MPRRKTRPAHYRLVYQEANLDLIRIEKMGTTEDTHFYLLSDLGGVGACNCPRSLMRIYKKRRQLVQDTQNKHGPNEVLKQASRIRQTSGICHHELMILEAEQLRERVQTELDRRFGERRWKPRSTILLAEGIRQTHHLAQIQSTGPNDLLWIDFAIPRLLEGIEGTGPRRNGEPMNPPDWIWTNKKILEKALRIAAAITQERIQAVQRTFIQGLSGLQSYLSHQAEATLVSKHSSTPAQLITGFCETVQPWLTPCQKAALSFIALNQDPPPNTEISFEERETFHRFGGKGRVFLEVFAR